MEKQDLIKQQAAKIDGALEIIKAQNKIISECTETIRAESEFKLDEKVILTEMINSTDSKKTEVYISGVGVSTNVFGNINFSGSKKRFSEPPIFYRFNKINNDGSKSKHRYYVEDELINIEHVI